MTSRGVSQFGLAAFALLTVSCSSSSTRSVAAGADGGQDAGIQVTAVGLPLGAPGIGFDDLRYARGITSVLAPAGRTGELDLVNTATNAVTAIGGFSSSSSFTLGSHSSGTTSADEGHGVIFAIDHETQTVRVVDESTNAISLSAPLGGAPDYVRWVATSGEIWVTEPGTGLEVLTATATAAPASATTVAISGGGPEAIAVDSIRNRVYTNSFLGQTFAVDVPTHAVVETWSNGCSLSLGLALDEQRGFLFVACATGSVQVLDVAHAGKKLGTFTRTTDLDILSYSPSLHHLYVPGGQTADLAIVGVSAAGVPSLLGIAPTAMGSKEVVADDDGNAWVADQAGGRLLKVSDPFPPIP
jgi:hypothetical protein